jgi:hypothetical protein
MEGYMNSPGHSTSYRYLSVLSEGSFPKKSKTAKWKLILKIIAIVIALGIILYILIDYENFNSFLPEDLYKNILENYDKIIIYADVINYLTNYHVFFICFIIGFCVWNIYKSFIHIFGFISIGFFVFSLKLIFMKKPEIFNLDYSKYNLSYDSLNTICSFTSEYECPSYRAAYVVYSYMSFISLLFKEKKIRDKNIPKIFCKVFFSILCIFLNFSLILLLQNTLGSIVIGSAIGFIAYLFMFSILKIDYDRNEQMLSILNFNIVYYILINIAIVVVILCLYFFIDIDDNERDNYQALCGETSYYFKEMNLETVFKSLIFFCNLTMIICIKLQRKYIFKSDGAFLSRNFNEEEILEENNLVTQIKGVETLKFNIKNVVKYLCRVLICLGVALCCYLLFEVFKYFKDENYTLFGIFTYFVPTNLLIIFLFFFSKWLFIYLDFEVYTYST